MNNFFMFLLLIFVGGQMLSLFMEGRTGISNTPLTSDITEISTTLDVVDTSGFLPSNFVILGDEDICYTGKTNTTFTGLTRGCNDTDAAIHSAGTLVYDEGSGFLNRAINMQEHEATSEGGFGGWLKGKFRFIGVATSWVSLVKQIVSWDYAYLDGLGIFVKMPLYVLSAGLVFGLFRMVIGR
jgi:hypothetical protein